MYISPLRVPTERAVSYCFVSDSELRRSPGWLAPWILAASVLFLASSVSAADRVELRDGSVVYGTFKDADEGKIVLETGFAGTMEIDQAELPAVSVSSEPVLQLDDGTVIEAGSLEPTDE